jgi:uncharacterized membrane protein
MKSKQISEFSNEELVTEVKKRKVLFLAFCGMVALLVCCGIFLTVKQGFGVFTMLPIVFISFIVIIRKNYIDAKIELESRNTSN